MTLLLLGCGGPDGDGSSPGDSVGQGGRAGGANGGATADRAGTTSLGGASGASGDAGNGGSTDPHAGATHDAGEGGESGGASSPKVFEQVSTVAADKVDLLFVIDNSISMGEKQELFREAVPLIVQRLITPVCVDASGAPLGGHADAEGICAAGEPEFQPLRDIHIGVITSSLGSHGGDVCEETADDKAHLLPSVRPGLASWNDAGFLAWDPDGGRNDPPGTVLAATLIEEFTDMVAAVGDAGCGYEATLEAWYRFLVDPDPPLAVSLGTNGVNEIAHPDPVTLAQRAAFLRADSLLGIVVLSDENDCSLMDEGQGWIPASTRFGGSPFFMPRATSVCETDPNDPCCMSCSAQSASPECNLAADPACETPNHVSATDNLNLRCFEQKRRFGVDFLYPIERYVDALTSPEVRSRSGDWVRNPLFEPDSAGRVRDPARVFVTGIVGVPWQDVADESSLSHARKLTYLSYDELTSQDRWSLILGEGTEPPRDALMYETPVDRSTLGFEPHPLTGDELAPASSRSPSANSINGHESVNVDNMDLQYACIFPLAVPRDCSDETRACDCGPTDQIFNRALCQPPGGGVPGITQYFANAYPGVRHLQFLRAFGEKTGNSIVASICPKVLDSATPSTDPDFGYNPAITATIERMKSGFQPGCLSAPLDVDASGRVACHVLELSHPNGACRPCQGGRSPAEGAVRTRLVSQLEEQSFCGGVGQPSCDSLCVCEVEQLSGAELTACRSDAALGADVAGFCYVDAAQGDASAALVQHCPIGRRRRLRFVGEEAPDAARTTFLLCE